MNILLTGLLLLAFIPTVQCQNELTFQEKTVLLDSCKESLQECSDLLNETKKELETTKLKLEYAVLQQKITQEYLNICNAEKIYSEKKNEINIQRLELEIERLKQELHQARNAENE